MNVMDTHIDHSIKKPASSLLALASLLLVISASVAKLRAAAEAQAPEGYEDATGFHFGPPHSDD
jgi:hypothetical protein